MFVTIWAYEIEDHMGFSAKEKHSWTWFTVITGYHLLIILEDKALVSLDEGSITKVVEQRNEKQCPF